MDGTGNGIFCPNLCHNNLQPKLDAIVSSIRIRTGIKVNFVLKYLIRGVNLL